MVIATWFQLYLHNLYDEILAIVQPEKREHGAWTLLFDYVLIMLNSNPFSTLFIKDIFWLNGEMSLEKGLTEMTFKPDTTFKMLFKYSLFTIGPLMLLDKLSYV